MSGNGARRVLVLEDEQIVVDRLALILKQNGYDTMAVYSGEMAVEAAPIVRPDVLITDLSWAP